MGSAQLGGAPTAASKDAAKEIRNGLTQYIARQHHHRLGTLDTIFLKVMTAGLVDELHPCPLTRLRQGSRKEPKPGRFRVTNEHDTE